MNVRFDSALARAAIWALGAGIGTIVLLISASSDLMCLPLVLTEHGPRMMRAVRNHRRVHPR